MHCRKTAHSGFTLIELSIVLVIIGLIVGGVLVGEDLIRAAGVRAQMTQIEQFNTAANTFRDKYGGLPGDLPNPMASSFGFAARGSSTGEGDGNGVIQGQYGWTGGWLENTGETCTFWTDLGTPWYNTGDVLIFGASLVSGKFYGIETVSPGFPITATSAPSLNNYFPAAKIGNGNYVYVWSGGIGGSDGTNYFGLSAVTSAPADRAPFSAPGVTVQQAYAIDKKMDDGNPQTGNVTAIYMNASIAATNAIWAAGGGVAGASPGIAVAGSSTTCYDNGGNASNPMQYSVEISNGSGVNCALSFHMQAGD